MTNHNYRHQRASASNDAQPLKRADRCARADPKAKMWKTPGSVELVRNIPDTVTKGNE